MFYRKSIDSGANFGPEVVVTGLPFNPNQVSRFPVFCAAFIGDYIDIDAVNGNVAIIWTDNRNAGVLSPANCQDFRTRPTDPTIQATLNSGVLDQEAFAEINP